jgi:hypothetical protein
MVGSQFSFEEKGTFAMASDNNAKPAQPGVAAAKKPYQAPVLKDWGSLKDVTLSSVGSRGSDGGRGPARYTH